ncbi:MAG: ferredoxin reductase family protein [Alphaproteobacteria bacterium]|nr:ferredoxin reductase family protein [Alphaproteobacteria bacterium]
MNFREPANVSESKQTAGHRAAALPGRLVIPGLVIVYVAMLMLPIVAAWLQGLPPRSWRDDLSSALALCAFAGILIEFVLSGRFRFVSSHIGIDTTMRVHQLMARTFTLFILVHPFLYVTRSPNYPMPWDTTRQMSVDFGIVSVLTGLVAWLALFAIVVMGIFREQRTGSYEAWRASHGIGAALVATFGTWHALEAGRYSTLPFLAWFWIAMLALALLTLVWVYVAKPLWQLRNPYVVRSVRPIADRTWELVVAPDRGETIRFEAGQFVWLNVGHSPFSLNENPFSIASTPTKRDQLAFVIKEVGDFTRRTGEIKPGSKAFVDGPHGNMTVAGRGGAGIALYAGGVGIAPILSILRNLQARGEPRPVLLLYGNRSVDQIVYGDELEAMTGDLDLQVEHFLSEPPASWLGRTGFIDTHALDEIFASRDPGAWLHVICGPLPMIEGIESALLERGIPSRQIISERFYYD